MLSFRQNRFPYLIAIPATLFMLWVLVEDQGAAGWWGFTYNRAYLVLLWGSLFAGSLTLSRRPLFSAGLASTLIGGLWVGAWIKFQFLGSQLIMLDLAVAALSLETLLEMELLPTLLTLGLLLLLVVTFWLEKPLPLNRQRWAVGLLGLASLFAVLNIPPCYVDLQWTAQKQNTLPIFVQSIWRARLEEPTPRHKVDYCCFKGDAQAEAFTHVPAEKPNIIVILEESTFRPEQVVGFKPTNPFFPDPYPLKVYTAGGMTWVQEIAFLHGVAPPLYGAGWRAVNLFAPGRLDGRIARQLAGQGYATKTIYPIAGRFYGGQRFHQQLGMQEFTDCNAMPECAKRKWNKMPDEIFFNEAVKQLDLSTRPVFMFIATMLQHSPHDKDRAFSAAQCSPDLSQTQCSIMLDYNERLKGSVGAYQKLLQQLKQLNKRTIVVAFGDHIPGDVAFHFEDKNLYKQDRFRTFFSVWDSAHGFVTRKLLDGKEFETIDIAMLDALVMEYAGFESRYLADKLVHMQACGGSFCALETENPHPETAQSEPQIPAL